MIKRFFTFFSLAVIIGAFGSYHFPKITTKFETPKVVIDWDTIVRKVPTKTHVYQLSGEKVGFKIHNPQDEMGVLYYNMHDDENTAVEAMEKILLDHGGKFVELQFKGKRWIGGWMNAKRHFWFDPNRIYTDLGIYKTLRAYQSYNSYSRKEVKKLGQFITKELLKDAKMIVALHNNQRGYNILKYLKDSIFEEDAAMYYINKEHSPHDFFYIVDTALYDFVVSKGYNAVLQNPESVADDGSLSVYCANQGIPYVNVEAKKGHLKQQIEMIELLQEYIWCDTLFNLDQYPQTPVNAQN
jgi:hypothetical protein